MANFGIGTLVQAHGFDLRRGSVRQCLCVISRDKKGATVFVVQNEDPMAG